MSALNKLTFVLLLGQCMLLHTAFAQGWMARVTIDVNHNYYAFEKISSATFTYSGVTVSGSSQTTSVQFTLYGTGAITGSMRAYVSGTAWEPYDRSLPYSTTLSVSYSGTFTATCTNGFFEGTAGTGLQQIHIWIIVYPRLSITEFSNNCEQLTFTSATCSPIHVWEVSDSPYGPFRVLKGKDTPSITVSRQDLEALGFDDPYGRKYFRVTGYPGTTSEMQAMDVYYPPPSAFVHTTPPKCFGSSDGSATVVITSANPAVINDFVITLFSDAALQNVVAQDFVNDGFTHTFTGLPAGNYWIKLENNSAIGTYGNCWAVATVPPLVNPPKISITSVNASNFNGFNVSCAPGNDGWLEVHASGGTGVYTYEWTPSVSTSARAEHLAAGTYEVRVRDSNGCRTDKVAGTLSAPPELKLNLRSTGGANGYDVSCADKHDGRIETDVWGGVPSYSYRWSDGTTASALPNASAASYSVRVTDRNGCTSSASITLAAPPPIDFTIAEITGIRCPGDRSGVLEIQSLTNTLGSVNYHWSSGETTKDIRDKSSGTYSATVTDGQGCTATRQYTLVEPSPWLLQIKALHEYNGVPIRCNGDDSGALAMIVRDGDGNTVDAQNYTWYRNGTQWVSGPDYASLSGLTAGNYRGTATYNDFCTLEETITLNEPPPLETAISIESTYNGMPVSCFGASDARLRVTASGGTGNTYTFTWNDGTTGSILDDIPAGKYTVTTTDINGCESKAEATVREPDPIRTSIIVASNYYGQAISCAAARDAHLRVSATGGTGTFSYVWNTGETGPELIGIGAGEYRVTVTDENGCGHTTGTTLTEPEPVVAAIVDRSDYNGFGVSCNGSEDGYLLADASGGTGIYTFNWNGEHSLPLYTNLSSGTYPLTVTDENGCTATTNATVTEPPPMSLAIIDRKEVSCHGGDDGKIQLEASGGTGDYLYSADGSAWDEMSSIADLQAGTHILRARDSNGCIAEASQLLAEPEALTIAFDDIAEALCGQPTGRVSASVSGGSGAYAYRWTNEDSTFISTEPGMSGLRSGVYTLKVTDEHLCETSRSVGIPAADGPKADIANIVPASCSYSSDGSAEIVVTQGRGPFTIRWPDGQTGEMAVNLRSGNYMVTVTDANNCTTVAGVIVPGPDSLEVTLVERVSPSCHGSCSGRLLIAATGGNGDYTYDWGGVDGAERDNLCAGTYNVTVVDSKSCRTQAAFTLEEPKPITLSLKHARNPVCHDGCDGQLEVQASGGSGPLDYEWSGEATTPALTGLCAGTYSVTVSDANNCTTEGMYVLENPADRSIDLGGSATLCAGQTRTLDAGPGWNSISWSSNNGFGSSNQQVTIAEAGMYWVEAVSNAGCIARDTFLLETSADLLHANFLMATEAEVMDTIVMIDISWPLPDNTRWTFPKKMTRLADFGDVVHGQFPEAGAYDVSLTAALGDCRDELTKTITIYPAEKDHSEGRVISEPFIKTFALYPNPNEGTFDVVVEFREQSDALLTIWNVLMARKIARAEMRGQKSYRVHFALGPLSAGPYTLRLDCSRGTRHRRFIVR